MNVYYMNFVLFSNVERMLGSSHKIYYAIVGTKDDYYVIMFCEKFSKTIEKAFEKAGDMRTTCESFKFDSYDPNIICGSPQTFLDAVNITNKLSTLWEEFPYYPLETENLLRHFENSIKSMVSREIKIIENKNQQ